jgi:uncharacterized protein involved in type VI secretion and phage assembly
MTLGLEIALRTPFRHGAELAHPRTPWRSHRLGKPLEDGLDLAIVVHRRPHDLDVEREEGVNVYFCWNSRG